MFGHLGSRSTKLVEPFVDLNLRFGNRMLLLFFCALLRVSPRQFDSSQQRVLFPVRVTNETERCQNESEIGL